MSRHDIAGIWGAFFSRCQRSIVADRMLSDVMALPPPHSAPFHAMLAHPAIAQRVQWMLGP